MAVGTFKPPILHPVPGIKLGTACAGIKSPNKKDLVVIASDPGSQMHGVFTSNAFCAAPVHICRQHLQQSVSQPQLSPQYLVINTGNANAGTGKQGLVDAKQMCQIVADNKDVNKTQVLPFSTGVIGEPLPIKKIGQAIPHALANLGQDNWLDAAHGILTTDTRIKGASTQVILNGKPITITGIAKGAGMIRPNMATMLAFIATDACLSQALTKQLLEQTVNKSFNRISVDGDMSTNDACMLIASGASQCNIDNSTIANQNIFSEALENIMVQLAQAIVRDGEGATKMVTIQVTNGQDSAECMAVGYAIAHSPLIKTALFASDPNWGRILAAVGYADINNLDINALNIYLGDLLIVTQGGRAASYTEAAGQAQMNKEDITIKVELNRGQAQETVWTTDLSYEYVRINADYRS